MKKHNHWKALFILFSFQVAIFSGKYKVQTGSCSISSNSHLYFWITSALEDCPREQWQWPNFAKEALLCTQQAGLCSGLNTGTAGEKPFSSLGSWDGLARQKNNETAWKISMFLESSGVDSHSWETNTFLSAKNESSNPNRVPKLICK